MKKTLVMTWLLFFIAGCVVGVALGRRFEWKKGELERDNLLSIAKREMSEATKYKKRVEQITVAWQEVQDSCKNLLKANELCELSSNSWKISYQNMLKQRNEFIKLSNYNAEKCIDQRCLQNPVPLDCIMYEMAPADVTSSGTLAPLK